MEINGICKPIRALGCLFVNFRAIVDDGPFADVTCRELSFHYEEYVNEHPTTSSKCERFSLNLKKGASLVKMVST